MKYRLWACLLFLPMVLWASGRPKVAVVLSGGGAKGTAHIGALKVIEEAGIPIDYVVGTSMGAIVGCTWSLHGRRQTRQWYSCPVRVPSRHRVSDRKHGRHPSQKQSSSVHSLP